MRVSGKRTLAKLNAFDLVVTVALGSSLATIVLSEDVALLEGVTAFAALVALQAVASWTSVRSRRSRGRDRPGAGVEAAVLETDGSITVVPAR